MKHSSNRFFILFIGNKLYSSRRMWLNCFIFYSLFFNYNKLLAQKVSLVGKVVDSRHQPLEFIEATLYKSDSILVANKFTDSAGKFELSAERGNYKLLLKQSGNTFLSTKIDLLQDMDIGETEINNSIQLKGVEIKAVKNQIERKVDRLVFHLENSLVSQGVDLTEALAVTPLLKVTEKSIEVVGKSDVGVMINGKLLNLTGDDLMNYLKSLRSDNVADIEVITTPPAKYEAQGNSGLINIVLKRNPNVGFSGNASTSYTQRTYAGIANTITLNYQSEKISSSITLRQSSNALRTDENRELVGESSVLMRDIGKSFNDSYGGNIRLGYKINDNSEVGMIYDLNKRRPNSDVNDRSVYRTSDIQTDIRNTFTQDRHEVNTHTLNAYYDQKLDDKGKNISMNINYFANIADAKTDLYTTSEIFPDENEVVRNLSNVDYRIWSGQADLILPYKWAKIETGVKFTKFDNTSDVGFYDLINGDYIINSVNSNAFDYDEKNYAGYISSSRDFGTKLTVQAGIRYEHSKIEGFSPTTESTTRFNYGNWFPTAYLMYKINTINTLSVSYSRRIDRPQFSSLNPFRRYVNPYAYFTGNPLLQPSFSNNAEITYGFRGKLNITGYWMQIKNGSAPYQSFEDGVLVTTYGNYFDQQNWGLDFSYSDDLAKWWNNYTSVSTAYAKPTIHEINAIAQSGYSFFYHINNTFTVNQAKTILLLLNYNQGLASRQTNFHTKSMANLTAGIRYTPKPNRFTINLSVTDIFRQEVARGEVFFTDNVQYYNNYFDNRKLNVSVAYYFGNRNVKGKNKKIEFDEKSRATN